MVSQSRYTDIHSFPAGKSAIKGQKGGVAIKPANSHVVSVGKALNRIASTFEWLDW